MGIDKKDLPEPSEEEWQWAERMAAREDDFPGEGGVVAHRLRLEQEAAERKRRFAAARAKFHSAARPRVDKKAA